MRVSAGDFSFVRYLSSFSGMGSGPVTLLGLILLSSFSTPGVVLLMSGTVGYGLPYKRKFSRVSNFAILWSKVVSSFL